MTDQQLAHWVRITAVVVVGLVAFSAIVATRAYLSVRESDRIIQMCLERDKNWVANNCVQKDTDFNQEPRR